MEPKQPIKLIHNADLPINVNELRLYEVELRMRYEAHSGFYKSTQALYSQALTLWEESEPDHVIRGVAEELLKKCTERLKQLETLCTNLMTFHQGLCGMVVEERLEGVSLEAVNSAIPYQKWEELLMNTQTLMMRIRLRQMTLSYQYQEENLDLVPYTLPRWPLHNANDIGFHRE